MLVRICSVLIFVSTLFSILIYTSFSRDTLITLGCVFEIVVVLVCIILLVETLFIDFKLWCRISNRKTRAESPQLDSLKQKLSSRLTGDEEN